MKRQFAWSLLPLMSVTVINIISVPWFYRYLGPEMYALWLYVQAFSGMFGFSDLGLNSAVGRYVGVALGKGDKEAARQYWGTGNLIAIPLLAFMALAFISLGVYFGPLWFNKLDPQNVHLLRLAFCCGGIGLFISYYSQLWLVLSQAHLDFKFIGVLRTTVTVVQISLAMWLAYLTHNPVILIVCGLVTGTMQLGFYAWHAARKYGLGLNLRDASRVRAREMSGYTAKIFGNLLVNCLFGPLDRFLLGKLVAPAIFTHYNICYNFGARIQGLSVAIMGPVFNHTSRAMGKDSKKTAAKIFDETFEFVFDWYALIGIWVACWHPVLLRLWLGRVPGLPEAVSPSFTPLVIAFCVSAIANVSGAQLGPLNRAGTQLGFTIVNMVGLCTGVLLGWHFGGLAGIAWGVLASRIVLVAQDIYVIRLIGSGGWLSMRTWNHLLMQVVVGVVFYFAARTLPHQVLLPATAESVLAQLTELPWQIFMTVTHGPSLDTGESLLVRLLAVRWQLLIALAHGFAVAGWLLRHQVRKFVFNRKPPLSTTPETAI